MFNRTKVPVVTKSDTAWHEGGKFRRRRGRVAGEGWRKRTRFGRNASNTRPPGVSKKRHRRGWRAVLRELWSGPAPRTRGDGTGNSAFGTPPSGAAPCARRAPPRPASRHLGTG